MANKLAKIANEPNYSRDMNTKAVLLTNVTTLNNYENQKKKMAFEKGRIVTLEDEVDSLKRELNELRNLIETIKK